MSDMITITVNGEERVVPRGTPLSELFLTPLPCGGNGKCGKCKIRATGELSPLTRTEVTALTEDERESHVRLACRTFLLGPAAVETVGASDGKAVLTGGVTRPTVGTPGIRTLGCAIDIGTTTLAAALIDPAGQTLAECGRANPQAVFGADVISRVAAAAEGRADALAEVILSALGDMIGDLCRMAGKDPADVDGVTVTGNPAMMLLLTGTPTVTLSRAPFTLPRLFGETVRAEEIGLGTVLPGTEVYLPPCISAFVGADTVCALLSSGICEGNETAMLADIGTNGEMALWCGGRLTVCSTAAGPAFEGVGISMGMCGAPGAIDRVENRAGELHAHVIGDVPPVGICGSGLVDAAAVLLDTGRLDETGYLDGEGSMIAPPVLLTPKDIRMLQLAKSAISAGMLTLLHDASLTAGEVGTLFLAGGFGNCLNAGSAARIGLLPAGMADKVKAIGNAALAGAKMLLTDRDLRARAESLARSASLTDLTAHPFFSEQYIMGMTFPDENGDLF